jgi:hypothetical protein
VTTITGSSGYVVPNETGNDGTTPIVAVDDDSTCWCLTRCVLGGLKSRDKVILVPTIMMYLR